MTTRLPDLVTSPYAELVARAVRVCNANAVMDYNGHVSARDEANPNVMWINNRHSSRSTLTAADIVPFDLAKGQRIGDGIEPPSEWYIHASIYQHRPDVTGIVHSHPEHIVALSAVGKLLRPVTQGGAQARIPEDGAPLYDRSETVHTHAMGEELAAVLGDAPVVVLRQHGVVTVGNCVEQAVVRMISCEANARQLCLALAIGEPNYIRGEEWRRLAGAGEGGKHGTIKQWTYYEETAQKTGAFD